MEGGREGRREKRRKREEGRNGWRKRGRKGGGREGEEGKKEVERGRKKEEKERKRKNERRKEFSFVPSLPKLSLQPDHRAFIFSRFFCQRQKTCSPGKLKNSRAQKLGWVRISGYREGFTPKGSVESGG